jgi:hypothetical protein
MGVTTSTSLQGIANPGVESLKLHKKRIIYENKAGRNAIY